MKIRIHDKPIVTGHAHTFNTHSISEVIVYFDEGDSDSMFMKDLDVLLPSGWKPLIDAFKDHDLIRDNYNTHFFQPANEADRARGFTL